MTLGERIHLKRNQRGHSQRGLAALADVSPSTICRVEQGKGSVSVSSLQAIAKALGTTTSWLLDGDEPTSLPWSHRVGLEHVQDCYQTLGDAINWALAMGYSEKQIREHVAMLATFKRLGIHQDEPAEGVS